jgi:hypothetical protein
MSRARRHLAPARKHALERGRVLFNSHASPTCPYELLPLPRDSAALRNQNGLSLQVLQCPCGVAHNRGRAPKLSTGAVGNSEKIGPAIKKQGSNINGRVRASRRWQAWPASHPRGHCLARFEGEGCTQTVFIGLGFPRTAVQVFVPGFEVGFRPQF